MVLLCLLKVKLKTDYRSISPDLKGNPDQLKLVELDRAPSHSVIRDAFFKIPESYLRRINGMLVEPLKKGIRVQTLQASPQSAMKHGSV